MAFLTAIRAQQRAGESLGRIVSCAQELGDRWRVQSWADKDFHSMGGLSGVYIPLAPSSLERPSRWPFPLSGSPPGGELSARHLPGEREAGMSSGAGSGFDLP